MSVVNQVSSLNPWDRVLVIFVFFWGISILIFTLKLNISNSLTASNDDAFFEHRLNQAIEFLKESKRRNMELKRLIDNLLE